MNRAARHGVWRTCAAAIAWLLVVVAAACGNAAGEGTSATAAARSAVQDPQEAPPRGSGSEKGVGRVFREQKDAKNPPDPSFAATQTAPRPVTDAPAAADDVAGATEPMTARTKAIQLRIEGVDRVASIGDRVARPGYEFVIVDTSWKNVIPLRAVSKKPSSPYSTGGFSGFGGGRRSSAEAEDVTMESTPYVVPMLRNQMWLLSDGRFADTVDTSAQPNVPDSLPVEGFSIAKLDDVVRGKVVFEAPAGITYQAFQFYDTNHGHALIPVTGSPAAAPPPVGAPQQNALLQLAVADARFLAPENPSTGVRPFLVTLRGQSRSPKDVVVVPARYVFAQTEQGCVASPETNATELSRPFGDGAPFVPTGENEAQLVFQLPADSRGVRLLVRAQTGAMDVPVNTNFSLSWPKPTTTIADGGVLRVHVLPAPAALTSLPPPPDGRTYQLLDVVMENLRPTSGVELQMEQLRLEGPDGSFVEPSPLSADVPCRLSGDGVIPPGTARRFTMVYEVEAGTRLRRLQYRGFELQETSVELP